MKLTKQIKADLAKAYQCAMEISILDMKAPLRYINQYIAENVSGYGTAADEKVQSREDYRKMLMKSRQQAKGMLFKAKIITPYRPKFTDETTAKFHDEIVVQIGDNKNKHSIHLYMSCVYKYQFDKWQLVLFHGSMPDAASTTEDTFHLGEAQKKLQELEQVVTQRTADLQIKTRELEIEASLERVRAVTMGMNKPGDILNICKVFFNELQSLGFKDLRNTLINFWDDENGQLHDYDYSDFAGGNFAKLAYSSHPAFAAFQKKIRKAKDAFAKLVINKQGLKSWQQRRRSSGEYKDPRLNKISALYYYFYSTGVGALGISTFSPISKDEVEVLKKFRNVFDMAYQRYVDIQKAEAQAREVQIELALERVRAAAMAMRASTEIGNLIYHLYGELNKLDAQLERCFIMIVNPENLGITWWMAGMEGLLNENGFFVQYNQHPTHLLYLKHWKNHTKKWNYLFKGKEKKDWDIFGFTQTDLSQLPAPVKAGMSAVRSVYLSGSSDTFGCLVTGSMEQLSDGHQEIISRFATVFNQTYTRFLDLKKAEAQTREAEIELALERVRARTMAMQHSNELPEAANLLFQQVQLLGMPAWSAGYCTWNDDKKSAVTLWMSSEGVLQPPFTAPTTKDELFIEMRKGAEENKALHVVEMGGKKLVRHYQYMRTLPVVGEILDSIIKAGHPLPTFQIMHQAYFSKGFLLFITYEPVPDAHEIFQRFGKVFDQTYTRFLDLQKAEAQAKEAMIEAALEKVRSRSLAMHKSDELNEVVMVLFERLKDLQIPVTAVGIHIFSEGSKDLNVYVCGDIGNGLAINNYLLPYFNHPIADDLYDAHGKGLDFFVGNYSKNQKNSFYKHLFEHSALRDLSDDIKNMIFQSESYSITMAPVKNSVITVNDFEGKPLSDAEADVVKRFAKVFEQAYIRFLDLQKAEAQAREAQIEGALERVRSQSMGMQTSKDLSNVTTAMFEQLRMLGGELYATGIVFCDKHEHDVEQWHSVPGAGMLSPFIVPVDLDYIHQYRYDQWKKGVELFSVEIPEDFIAQHFEAMFNLPTVKAVLDDFAAKNIPMPETPSWEIDYGASFKHGYILVSALQPFSSANILPRFAKVFEQTYTRFLDLQKAEAQAREAQIEAALEKVRSRSLAMQKPEELVEVAELLREEMGHLGVEELETSSIYLVDKENRQAECWYAIKDIRDGNKKLVSDEMTLLLPDTRVGSEMWKFYQSDKAQASIVMKGDNRKEWINYCANRSQVLQGYYGNEIPERTYHLVKFNGGYMGAASPGDISSESWDLLKRAAAVFSFAYTRFKDLQDAAARAREAQIELALERVRSRSMAMHKSDELKEVIQVVYEQFIQLDIHIEHTGFIIDYKERDDMHIWLADQFVSPFEIAIPYFDSPHWNSFVNAKRKGENFFANLLTFEEKNKFYQDLFQLIPSLPEESKQTIFSKPGLAISTVLLDNVGLYIENFSGIPFTDEENTTLMRFGKVFQQTYTRFLDLQKAEAQAKEAQIEAALERVRSRSLAMHSSGELGEVVTVVLNNLLELGYIIDQGSAAHLAIFSEGTKDFFQWSADPALPHPVRSFIPYTDLPILTEFWDARQKGHDFLAKVYSFDEKNTWFNFAFEHSDLKHIPGELKKLLLESETYAHSIAIEKNSAIIINSITGNQLSGNQIDILRRFSKVFEQAYVRFLDLQKAEAQAREARIEAALEKVRSRSLAMHKADELGEVITVVVEKLQELDFSVSDGVALITYNEGSKDLNEWMANPGFPSAIKFHLPYFKHPVLANLWKAKNNGTAFLEERYTAEENKSFLDHIFKHSDFKHTPQPVKDYCLAANTYATSIAFQKNTSIFINDYSGKSLSEQEIDILKRFSKVFEQAYIRFLDLQKAEAQAREAKIEMALEKIRSRTMAMQHSDELPEAANLLFLEVQALGIPAWSCGYNVLAEDKKTSDCWMSSEGAIQEPFNLYFTEEASFIEWYNFIQSDENFFVQELGGEALVQHYNYMRNIPRLGEVIKKLEDAGISLPTYQINHLCKYAYGFLLFITYEPVPDAHDLFKRFTKVFEQTYTRFLDLQKAEEQTREAQIELSLERIRAKVTAMKVSSDLLDIVVTMRTEFVKLGHEAHYFWHMRWLPDMYEKAMTSGDGSRIGHVMTLPRHIHGDVPLISNWEKTNEPTVVYAMDAEAAVDYVTKMINLGNFEQVDPNSPTLDDIRHIGGLTFIMARTTHGEIGYSLPGVVTHPPAEGIATVVRFASVFDLAYRRFEDLKSSEKQIREAQIELALERVRARSLAMHKSEELADLSLELVKQVQALDVATWFCAFNIYDENPQSSLEWGSNGIGTFPKYRTPREHVFLKYYEAGQKGETFLINTIAEDECVAHYEYLCSLPGVGEQLLQMKAAGIPFPAFQIDHVAFMKYGYVLFITYEPVPEAHDIFIRFAKVFEQTYTRFLDLQKAEAQAKEAQIEASLERVRSKTMAMHNSKNVGESVAALFDELTALGVLTSFDRCGIGIMQPNEMMELWTAEKATGKTELTIGHLNMRLHTLLKNVYQNWLDKKQTYEYILEGNDKVAYYEAMGKQTNYKIRKDYYSAHERIVHTDFFFKEGCLYVFSLNEFTTEATLIFIRFVNVFGQTYRRYLDLQKAEAQAKEAQIEAALERVRSRTLAMQKSDELAETAAEVFRQLINLGIEPNRLYIGIVKEETGDMEMWATDEDGTQVGKKFMFNKNENSSVKKLFDGWQAKEKSVIVDMQGKELEDYFHYLNNVMHIPFKGGLAQKRRVQSVAYFSKGFIGMASPDGQGDETIQLLERFAAVFNLTFTRFNDLKIAEAHAEQAEQDLIAIKEAKQKAEEALTELQATQKQLIQSEKMASLGELTAGIAHEIQNPLNFVNNFSEVSKELLDEMKEAIEKGDTEEAKEIMNDVIQNLEKINHHGKRADGIVKGMLQHSRSSSNQKEATDINALADEYLRLAYHGLRAKDKSFNATLKTEYDESIGKVSIIPQDMGRVILNLITNAFYVVAEKKKESIEGYEPTVSVSTKKMGDKMEVSVKDNGNGIPPKILDKIFQPFFTTKPTGQGTGLGLSLSYDIVKAHGGELKVETKEGEGSEFIIQLPI